MLLLVIGMNANRGFTLIEILVVIVILGITMGLALIAYGDFGSSRRLVFAVEQLSNTLTLAQEQAILETTTMGLRIDKSSYQILKYDNSGSWMPISNKGIFKLTYFPKNTQIIFKIDPKNPNNTPSIIIEPSGDMTPFTLIFGTAKEPNLATLTGWHNGKLVLTKAGK